MSFYPPGPLPFAHRWRVFWLFWLAVYLSPILILTARTARGRMIGLTGFCFQFLIVWPFTLSMLLGRPDIYCGMCVFYLLLFPLFFSIAATLRPKKQPGLPNDLLVMGNWENSGGFLKSVFWAEEDWLWTGVLLGTLIDPRVSGRRGKEIRDRVQGVLTDMRFVGVYRKCRTPWVHVFDGEYEHFPAMVAVVPEQPPVGAVIFLHGHGGNTLFQAFLLRDFAKEHRLIVLCPTLSYGPWELPHAKAMVAKAADVLKTNFEIPAERTFLAGLSQGAMGVAVAGAVEPFAGLVFLSPTMYPEYFHEKKFKQQWQGREVLVIHGEKDRHVSKASVDVSIGAMAGAGITVQASFHPHADHSLFLLDTEEVLAEVGAYCNRHLKTGVVL
jgi:hypothetical protein